jgi:hypothetical protein
MPFTIAASTLLSEMPLGSARSFIAASCQINLRWSQINPSTIKLAVIALDIYSYRIIVPIVSSVQRALS